ncbi:MmcQ/YjbR family DNA-binding protein [Nocardioides sp.]|uniref:MmcQ/YjbR family DNA-binding protein n=1 Tax=Nocardioides sp. TaxID=35761 RepID=UPI003511DCDF
MSRRPARLEPDPAIVERLRALCGPLPDVVEEEAWTGVRWSVRRRTFAHVMVAQEGYVAGRHVAGFRALPATVLTVHAEGADLMTLQAVGPPFHDQPWSPTAIGMVLDDDTDWDEVADLVAESWRVRAPISLRRRTDPPGPEAARPAR